MAKNLNLLELTKALTFYSDILEDMRRNEKTNRDLLEAQEHLVFSINKIKKVIKDKMKTLDQTRGE